MNLIFLFFFFILCSKDLFSIGYYQIGILPRYIALGGTGIALGGSAIDLSLNPANIKVNKLGQQLELGIGNSYFSANYSDKSYQLSKSDPFFENNNNYRVMVNLPFVGYTKNINDKLSYAVAFYVTGGGGATFDNLVRYTPQNVTATEYSGQSLSPLSSKNLIKESNISSIAISRFSNGLSYQINNLSIGISLDIVMAKQSIEYKYSDSTGYIPFYTKGFRYESDLAKSLGGSVGLSYNLGNSTKIGYAYQLPTSLNLDGTFDGGNGSIISRIPLDVKNRFTTAERHSFGISHYINQRMLITSDIQYLLLGSYFKSSEIVLPYFNYDSGLGLLKNLKSRNGSQNIYSIGIGVEYSVNKIFLRLGFNYSMQSYPERYLNPQNSPILLENVYTAGIGFLFNDSNLDIAIAHSPYKKFYGGKGSDWDISRALNSLSDYNYAYSYSSSIKYTSLIISFSKRF